MSISYVRLLVTATAAFLIALAPVSVLAQEPAPTALEARIEAVQRQLLDLQAALKSSTGTSQSADGGPSSLEARIEELSTQLKILARQVELDKEQAAERAKTTPQPAAGRGGFSLQSADGQFRVRLAATCTPTDGSSSNDSDERGVDTFVLRRVRPIVEATMYGIFDFRVMPDFGGGTTVLQDAYVDMRLRPQFKIRAGKFKPPLGFERLMSATEMPFIERALPTSLVPNRDLGLMVHGDLAGGNLAYAAGVFNGVVDGGSGDTDIQDGKDFVGRVFLQPFRARRDSLWQGLGAGIAGQLRQPPRHLRRQQCAPLLPNGRPERRSSPSAATTRSSAPPSPTGRTPASPRRGTTTLEPSGSWANTCFLPRRSAAALPTPPSITRHGRWPVRGS